MSREYRELLTKDAALDLEEKARGGGMIRGGTQRMWGRAIDSMFKNGTRTARRSGGGVVFGMKPKKGRGKKFRQASRLDGYLLDRYQGGRMPNGAQRQSRNYG